jgi:GT2 family glycosyltransferase
MPGGMRVPLLSIVIPSHDNRARLLSTLDSAARLAADPATFEVVVEDDASSDGTFEALAGRTYPFSFTIERGEHRNQSAATNAAIRRARGRFVLCAASDLVFDEHLVERHLAAHERYAGRPVAVQGYIPYTRELDEQPFMFYLMHGGPQFGFSAIRDERRLAPNFCYAPNLSVPREALLAVGGFDPFFRYGGQDTDLGYRLVQAGVRLVYEPAAIAWHDHPVTLEQYQKRQQAAGIATVLLGLRYPELEGGPPLWDAAIASYLGRPRAILDRDRCAAELLEPVVARAHPGYQRLWIAVVCHATRTLESLDPRERAVLQSAQALFGAYDGILRYHWGQAFIEEALRQLGAAHVAQQIRQRFLKSQTTLAFRRSVTRRLAGHGIDLELSDAHDLADTLIFAGPRDYREVWNCLDALVDLGGAAYNRQALVAVEHGRLSAEEIERIEDACEVVAGGGLEEAVVQAFARARGELVGLRGEPWRLERESVRHAVREMFAATAGLGLAEVPACGTVWIRGALAREIGAAPATFLRESDRGWQHALDAIVGRRGELACHGQGV